MFDSAAERARDAAIRALETRAAAQDARAARANLDATLAAVKAPGMFCEACAKILRAGKAIGWEGRAKVVVARLTAPGQSPVVDKDGDVIVVGALQNSDAIISRWNHSATTRDHEPPVGRALLAEVGDELLADLVFDDDDAGRAACGLLLERRPGISCTYHVTSTRPVSPAEAAAGATRIITGWIVTEVSAVDFPAAAVSGTLSACCGTCRTDGAAKGDGAVARIEHTLAAAAKAEQRAAEAERDGFIAQLERTAAALDQADRYRGGWAPDDPRRIETEERARDLAIRDLTSRAASTEEIGPCGRACATCAERESCPHLGVCLVGAGDQDAEDWYLP